jgi:hypothetical protein
MLTKQKPASARPPTKAGKRKRPQLGIIVSQQTRDWIEQLARDSGRSLGQQVEYMLERCNAYDEALTDIRHTVHTLEGVKTKVIETVLFRHMWSWFPTTRGGKVWAPPGTPLPVEIDTSMWHLGANK